MDEGIGDFDETSVRYKGKSIPSPSFRVLQTWADHDPNPSCKLNLKFEKLCENKKLNEIRSMKIVGSETFSCKILKCY